MDYGLVIQQKKAVARGNLDESKVWNRVAIDQDMPPSGPRLTEEEIDKIKRWIVGGAPRWQDHPVAAAPRPHVRERDVLVAIERDLQSLHPFHRRFQRYFTLHYLWNNPDVTPRDLRIYRAALAKLVNSLSWRHQIAPLHALPQINETVFRLDLREADWVEDDVWRRLVSTLECEYPYGMDFTTHPDQEVSRTATNILALLDRPVTRVFFLRGDWFVTRASQPPLYEIALRLPKNAAELEKSLEIDVAANVRNYFAARSGFVTSKVSENNRLIERHAAAYGAYWKSYDFENSNGLKNLLLNPLGPKLANGGLFDNRDIDRHAFEHDGGEIIFHLPNGLQGYYLADREDNYLAQVDNTDIVNDTLKSAGSVKVVNGLSCMHCHKHGMRTDFEDAVLAGSSVKGTALQTVQALYPPQERMMELVEKDRAQFLAALQAVTGRYLQTAEDADKPIESFAEPIGAIAGLYIEELDLNDVAAELDIPPEELKIHIKLTGGQFRQFGLGPLVDGKTIKRETWDSTRQGTSLYQRAKAAITGMTSIF